MAECSAHCLTMPSCTHVSVFNSSCRLYTNVTMLVPPDPLKDPPMSSPIPCKPDNHEHPMHQRRLLSLRSAYTNKVAAAHLGAACTKHARKKNPFKNMLMQAPHKRK
eukprot:TRINITY_DN45262_c0_g1_i1.p3 TRINITY_DN45262_c0_g1~~TRINITY_DN45262_c0_g1_i1.p3  ORF type:complete len:107 (+),score=31.97 TRINITY_DN45262_c0_g1_i1:2-322(+)